MCRAVIKTLLCLGIAIGRLNYTKEISSLIPNFMWSILTKEGCLFNFNCLGMIFFHLLQSFDSFLEKVMNAWIFIFLKKRINDLIYYGIGILVEYFVKYSLWTCRAFTLWNIFEIPFLRFRVFTWPKASLLIHVARSFILSIMEKYCFSLNSKWSILLIVDNSCYILKRNLVQIIITDALFIHSITEYEARICRKNSCNFRIPVFFFQNLCDFKEIYWTFYIIHLSLILPYKYIIENNHLCVTVRTDLSTKLYSNLLPFLKLKDFIYWTLIIGRI